MKQIYDFEQRTPPVLNEQMLRAELERRKLRIQTAVAVLAGFLLMIAAVLLGYSAIDWYPCTLSALLWIYHDCGNRRWCHRHRLFS